MILLDEPTSMLDVITQAQMIDFLRRYQQQHQTAYLFITHNTALAEQFCDEIVKMEDGHLLKRKEYEMKRIAIVACEKFQYGLRGLCLFERLYAEITSYINKTSLIERGGTTKS